MVVTKLPFGQEVCDVKLKMWISLSLTKKLLHTIKSNEDVEVTFDEYITDVICMITIYVEKEEEYY